MSKKTIIISIVVIAAVVIAASLLFFKPTTNTPPAANGTTNATTTGPQPASGPITYTDTGFHPQTTTVPAGTTVTFVNNANSVPLQVNSNPHPIHTDNPELNIGAIAQGQSKSVVLNKKGTWGYHNHLRSSDQGTITVQ